MLLCKTVSVAILALASSLIATPSRVSASVALDVSPLINAVRFAASAGSLPRLEAILDKVFKVVGALSINPPILETTALTLELTKSILAQTGTRPSLIKARTVAFP